MIGTAWLRHALAALYVLAVLAALYGAYHHGVTTERTRQQLAIEADKLERARMIITEQVRADARAAELDIKYTARLNDAQKQIDDLMRPGPAREPVRVYVPAKCPAPGPGAMSEAGTVAGVGGRSQQAAELDSAAIPDFDALLRDIKLKETALAACVEAHGQE